MCYKSKKHPKTWSDIGSMHRLFIRLLNISKSASEQALAVNHFGKLEIAALYTYVSESSYHIDTSVCDKTVKIWELYYVTWNDFLNRDTLYSHVGADINIFLAAECFLPNHVSLYTVGTAIQCWSKFPWKLWSKTVRIPRYRGSKSMMTSSFSEELFCFLWVYINLYTIGTAI